MLWTNSTNREWSATRSRMQGRPDARRCRAQLRTLRALLRGERRDGWHRGPL